MPKSNPLQKHKRSDSKSQKALFLKTDKFAKKNFGFGF